MNKYWSTNPKSNLHPKRKEKPQLYDKYSHQRNFVHPTNTTSQGFRPPIWGEEVSTRALDYPQD
jgi:hypothetical protein